MDIESAVEELCQGKGYLLFEGYFSHNQVAESREWIYSLAAEEPDRASHFHGDEVEATQKRVWNLPGKGAIFRTMLSGPETLAIMEPILGDDLMLSSYAANVLYEGAPAQEPDVGYPYPAVMDALPGRSSEGSRSKEQPRVTEYGTQKE